MSLEIWKPVVGYEGLYEVSNLGRVKRVKTQNVLKPYENRKGYLRVSLCRHSKQTSPFVHRLVAEAFIGTCPADMEVNHIDENRANNALTNLEYMTHADNNNYGSHTFRASRSKGMPVIAIDEKGRISRYYSISSASRKTHRDRRRVWECVHGRKDNVGGIVFRFDTAAEIEHYDLHDCECVEVTNHEQ